MSVVGSYATATGPSAPARAPARESRRAKGAPRVVRWVVRQRGFFVVAEVVPRPDEHFRTRPDRVRRVWRLAVGRHGRQLTPRVRRRRVRHALRDRPVVVARPTDREHLRSRPDCRCPRRRVGEHGSARAGNRAPSVVARVVPTASSCLVVPGDELAASPDREGLARHQRRRGEHTPGVLRRVVSLAVNRLTARIWRQQIRVGAWLLTPKAVVGNPGGWVGNERRAPTVFAGVIV